MGWGRAPLTRTQPAPGAHRLWLTSRKVRDAASARAASSGMPTSSLMPQWETSRFCSRVNCDISAHANTVAPRCSFTPPVASPKEDAALPSRSCRERYQSLLASSGTSATASVPAPLTVVSHPAGGGGGPPMAPASEAAMPPAAARGLPPPLPPAVAVRPVALPLPLPPGGAFPPRALPPMLRPPAGMGRCGTQNWLKLRSSSRRSCTSRGATRPRASMFSAHDRRHSACRLRHPCNAIASRDVGADTRVA